MQGDVVEIVALERVIQEACGAALIVRADVTDNTPGGREYRNMTFGFDAKAFLAALAQNGWAVVPLGPTQEQVQAGCDALASVNVNGDAWLGPDGIPAKIYRAMLSAAPSGARPRT